MPGLSWAIELIKGKWSPPKDTRPSFAGRNIIVTGAIVGLGLEAAAKFVQPGANRLIPAVRTIEKGEDAQAEIEARTGRKGVVDDRRRCSYVHLADRFPRERPWQILDRGHHHGALANAYRSGERKLQRKVFDETISALQKDVPQVRSVLENLKSAVAAGFS